MWTTSGINLVQPIRYQHHCRISHYRRETKCCIGGVGTISQNISVLPYWIQYHYSIITMWLDLTTSYSFSKSGWNTVAKTKGETQKIQGVTWFTIARLKFHSHRKEVDGWVKVIFYYIRSWLILTGIACSRNCYTH